MKNCLLFCFMLVIVVDMVRNWGIVKKYRKQNNIEKPTDNIFLINEITKKLEIWADFDTRASKEDYRKLTSAKYDFMVVGPVFYEQDKNNPNSLVSFVIGKTQADIDRHEQER